MKWHLYLLITGTLIFGHGCGGGSSSSSGGEAAQISFVRSVFSDAVTDFSIQVFYETGAEPYVGNIGLTANQTWDITKSSYSALFSTHTGRTITVPTTLAQMTSIGTQNQSSWSSSQLISLGSTYAPSSSATQSKVAVIFVKGLYDGNANILGVHFTGYPFVFVFKDVVTSVGGDPVSQRYVEQGTVVHEVGHAIGLVNLGLPMATDHEDQSHVHHTTDSDCVMYWAVASKSNVLTSIADFITGNQLNLFGSKALSDGRGYHP
ncbi:hypothetical protein QJS83_16945 [Bdellovibrio sp. 22V]|uniref:hypothetical protein n=1 Tax=Bdellovibrio sp. 22V TaxID=3044166 RepID=UPI002543853C|nr:hypothetical protein [Bdellovibrio sp. 22V]WII72152.1 hypothetical protein QJS83_16945 [Bdellovibrio sp. 22V]